jgi:hypothetical protein
VTKKSSESAQQKRRQLPSKAHIKRHAAELAELEAMRDDEISTADIPEKLNWSNAEIGKFYRPVRKLNANES